MTGARADRARRAPRPLLFVHGVYRGSWCFAEHLGPYFEARGNDVHLVDLPLGPTRFGMPECVEAVAAAWQAVSPPPVVIGHSLGGQVVRAALA
jgi:pimeloyl-ACP methyl ester carboxylesterase